MALASASVHMAQLLPKECVGGFGSKSQYTGQAGGEETLLYFRYWQLWGGGLSVQRPTPPPNSQQARDQEL